MNSLLYEEVGRLAKKWRRYGDYVDKSDPANRKALIEKNLRIAVDIALKYRGRGLSEDELISSAFLGLANAYDKYKEDNPNNVGYRILREIKYYTKRDDFEKLLYDNCQYGNIIQKYLENKPKLRSPSDFRKFVKTYIKPAKFSSTAYFWIMSQIVKDLREANSDSEDIEEHTDLEFRDFDSEEFELQSNLLYEGISEREETMINMRNGIGYDKMTYKEIASHYRTTPKKAKDTIAAALAKMQHNIEKYNIPLSVFLKD